MGTEQYTFRAGAGRSEIRYPLDVFPFREGPADTWTGIHDYPGVRAVILECGIRAAIVSLEVVIMDGDMEQTVRNMVVELTGIPAQQIWLSVTHTVSTPHIFIRDHNPPEENERAARMREKIFDAVRSAVTAALETVQDASMGFGTGTCGANVNRIIPTRDGWWLGSGEEGPVDHSVPVIRIDGVDGCPIALLYHYNTELAVMDKAVMSDGGRHITADLAGAASRFVETEYEDKVVALFLPGVATDQGPAYRAVRTVRGRNGSYREIDIGEQGWLLLELEGERLGEQVLVTAEQITCEKVTQPLLLDYRTFWFHGQRLRGLPRPTDGPVKEWPFTPTEDKTRSVEAMVLGDTVLVGVGGVGIRTALKIKELSPFANTIVLSGVTGGAQHLPTDGQKYMAERDLYEKVTFQARNSEFACGSAEQMTAYAAEFLKELKER